MDYEFRILVAEKELAHLREMQNIARGHLDVHDASFAAATNRFERIETSLEQAQATIAEIALLQKVTEQKLQGLIEILTREHGNGRK